MAILTVGSGQQFATVNAAVHASHDGDTIYVEAGTYVNDFSIIDTKISIIGVGGMAHFVAKASPPNHKAIFVTNTDVTFDHVEFSGTKVADKNGAGIKYQSGTLSITNSYFHDNQNGLLGSPYAGGTISIDHSEFAHNGAGDGYSHNIYVGKIASLDVTNSYLHDAVVGHELKSRAAITTVVGNRIFDNNGSASYSIDLPNGGAATIENNIIQQGPHSQNPAMIRYSEGTASPWPGSQLLIDGNTFVNQLNSASAYAVKNQIITAEITGNHIFGLAPSKIVSGPNVQSGNDFLSSAPALPTSHPWEASPWNSLVSGGDGSDLLSGSTNKDLMVDGAGADTLFGLEGSDQLLGGAGNDLLTGGPGADTLTGDIGADRFIFNQPGDFASGSTPDVITDFNHSEGDRIDLSGVDANAKLSASQAFTFIGNQAFHNQPGELHYVTDGSSLIVEGDLNGDGHADFSFVVSGIAALTDSDFIL